MRWVLLGVAVVLGAAAAAFVRGFNDLLAWVDEQEGME